MKKKMIMLLLFCLYISVFGAVLSDGASDNEYGLYNDTDHVLILTKANFADKVFNKKHAMVIEFYNRYCNYCKAFAIEYKSLATSVIPWQPIVKLAVIDCADNENNAVCRNYEIMSFPSARYFHENYVMSNSNLGFQFKAAHKGEELKRLMIVKMQDEQKNGRLRQAPNLSLNSFATYADAVENNPPNILYTFLVFVDESSTIGSEIILDLNDYQNVLVKRVDKTCDLAQVAGVRNFPGLVVIENTLNHSNLTPKQPTKEKLSRALYDFLKSNSYKFPDRKVEPEETVSQVEGNTIATKRDVLYYSDLERTLKISLENEITRYKVLKGEPLQALLDYLNVLISSFPFKGVNLREFIFHLKHVIITKNVWNGSDIYDTVKSLEKAYGEVYSSVALTDYVGCKGSEALYRGYPCGLWSLFHTLTVNAALNPGTEGPKVLRAMHGYIKYFFTCSDCSHHFVSMATKNKIFDVKENDKAVLWVWVAHNEVNLRTAGDVTEDPKFPKIQFPSKENCEDCRMHRGAWYLPAVYDYLIHMYGSSSIKESGRELSEASASSPFTNLDIGMLSLLYILSFIILIVVVKFFLTKRFLRKRGYKHGLGKV